MIAHRLLLSALAALFMAVAPGIALAKEVWLATVEPGALYWQRFGHNALIVRDGERGVSYNFGYFDFAQQDFLLRFLRGRMLYQAVAIDADADLRAYVAEGRRVFMQRLNLAPDQIERLDAHLRWHVAPDNRDYRYDYYANNCSTKVRDALDLALGGAIEAQHRHRSHGETYRRFTRAYAAPIPWLHFGTDVLLGQPVDRPLSLYDEMFIPGELKRRLRDMSGSDGRPLVSEEYVLPADADAEDVWPVTADLRAHFAALGLMIAALLVASTRLGYRRAAASISIVIVGTLAILGSAMALLWAATDHSAAARNENLLLMSPTWWLALPGLVQVAFAGRAGPRLGRWLRYSATAALVLVALGAFLKVFRSFDQSNIEWLLLVWPIVLALHWSTPRWTSASSP